MNLSEARQIILAAASIQKEAKELGFVASQSSRENLVTFERLVTDETLRLATRQLFIDGHYALAVEEAYKCLNNYIKSRSSVSDDGASLMRRVFSPKNPILKLNQLRSESQRNQQLGYMEIYAGCMTGIRNPRAHEYRSLDEPSAALEMLSLANHLIRLARNAKRSRPSKKKTVP